MPTTAPVTTSPITQSSRRKRGVQTETKITVTPEMERLAVECHLENQAALLHGNKAKKAREALYAAMKGAGIKDFKTQTTTASGALVLESVIKQPKRDVINVEKLRKNTTPEQFMACISASKGAVESNVGSSVAVLCAEDVLGEENVTVKPAK